MISYLFLSLTLLSKLLKMDLGSKPSMKSQVVSGNLQISDYNNIIVLLYDNSCKFMQGQS